MISLRSYHDCIKAMRLTATRRVLGRCVNPDMYLNLDTFIHTKHSTDEEHLFQRERALSCVAKGTAPQ